MINFRQFKNITLEFAHDPITNVTAIIGDNSYGKSTITQAFTWAIYDEPLDLDKPDNILNADVQKQLLVGEDAEASVEVELEHEGRIYIFERKEKYKVQRDGKIKCISSNPSTCWTYNELGEKVRNDEPAVRVREAILPKSLIGFFFFDGEHITKFNTNKDLKNSVYRLMGIEPLQNAIKHLKTIDGLFVSQLNTGNESKARELKQQYEKYAGIYEKTEKMLNDAYVKREAFKAEYEEADRIFVESSSLINLSQQIKQLEGRISQKQIKASEYTLRVANLFNDISADVLMYPAAKNALSILERAKKDEDIDEGVPGMNADSIQYLIKRGRCICGAELSEGCSCLEQLKREMRLLPPNSIGTEMRLMMQSCETILASTGSKVSQFERMVGDKWDVEDEVQSLQSELDTLKSQSDELNNVDAQAILSKRDSAQRDYLDSDRIVNNLERDLSQAEKNRELAKEGLDQLAAIDERNNKPRLCSQYANALIEDLEKTVRTAGEQLLLDFTEELNENFKNMYTGSGRWIEVTPQYRILIHNTEGIDTGISTGTKVVLNFAFVSTLLSMAKKQIESNSENLISEPYPLVLDAPSSEADDSHIGNVFKRLPEVSEQIIVVIMKKDWIHAKAALKEHLGPVYQLVKRSETDTRIERVDNV